MIYQKLFYCLHAVAATATTITDVTTNKATSSLFPSDIASNIPVIDKTNADTKAKLSAKFFFMLFMFLIMVKYTKRCLQSQIYCTIRFLYSDISSAVICLKSSYSEHS